MTQAQIETSRVGGLPGRGAGGTRAPFGVAVRRLATPTEIDRAFRSMGANARDEVVEMLPDRAAVGPSLRASRPDDLDSIERGVARYLVCEASMLSDPAVRNEIDLRRGAGARVRVIDRLPQWMRMFDRRAAILAEPSVSSPDALVIHESSVVRSLQTLFVGTWRQADGLARDTDPACRPRDRDVLLMMSRGDTDEAAARSMDVSVRTYRRYVADLMDVLGASSRFQAGALAAARGWL